MTPEETGEIVRFLSAAYPSWQVTAGTISVWHGLLESCDYSDVKMAAMALVRTSTFAPSIAQILREIAEEAQAVAPTYGDAWAEVRRAIWTEGFNTRDWTHRAIAEAVEAIGWYEIRKSDNQDTTRAQFRDIYKDIAARMDKQVLTSPNALGYSERRQIGEK